MFRPFLRPRWIAAHLVLLVVLSTFVSLGLWQLRRLDERRAYNERFTSRLNLPVADLDAIVGDATSDADVADLAYRRVRVTGTYDVANEVLILSRTHNTLAGQHVVTPLRSRALNVLVNRGWVPLHMNDAPAREAPPPAGRVTVTGVLFPSQERGRLAPRIAPEDAPRSYFRIEIPAIRPALPYPVLGLWLLLEEESPSQQGSYPRRAPPPRLDEGPHLSYAWQWFFFAAAALGTYSAFVRKASQMHRRRADLEEGGELEEDIPRTDPIDP